ncbi:hypothetical protein G4B84_006956 [Aspergillus flavus NRRL3357]|nr:uncharacterized protein G4B84_006956 [Aspergillus flavus NRRL3357]QMW31575.1 hypothetical protein G4B84_006956 [Aspergillus flavus NRRL3357]QMW46624.1 hypothetical protein G4B11_010079 [Aspergillus flavus]
MSTIQSYLAPPRGCRSRVWQFYRRWRTRNKEEGPYELFITYTLERVYAIPDDLLESARLKWLAAEADINSILWGTIEQRKAAKQNLESLNSREFDDTGVGCIEVENWFNAGDQLEKARFEDVRDFIWERIQSMKYPTGWRVKREDFHTQIENSTAYYTLIRRQSHIDTRDSVFHEWLLENPPYEPPAYRSSPESVQILHDGLSTRLRDAQGPIPNMPGYIFPPLGFRKEHETDYFTGEIVLLPEFTTRNPEDGPYGVFIESTENWSMPCPPDTLPTLQPFWNRARSHLHCLLWKGDGQQSARAKAALERINAEIKDISRAGVIEISNWSNAGDQLGKAVRDFHFYGSVCRFEDIRDFIWERITHRNYPTDWRVKREDFEEEILRSAEDYNRIRLERGVDTRDGIFYEAQLTHPPYSGQSPPPLYVEEDNQDSEDNLSLATPTPQPRQRERQQRQNEQYINQRRRARSRRTQQMPRNRDRIIERNRRHPRNRRRQDRQVQRQDNDWPEESPNMLDELNLR